MFEFLKSRNNQIIIGLLAVLTIISLWLRLIPMFGIGNSDILSMVASDDPMYNLRQIELIIANYPNYAWYDPMTLFPTGSIVYWGSLFPTIIATICIALGATTRPEIISVGLVIPPIMGALMVPVVYYIGKICGDWKTGIIAALFTVVVSGQFFYRSMYGYMDHHIAEVLFSTIFCLLYMYVLYSQKNGKISLSDFSTYKNLVVLSVITGIAYIIGLLTMPTMILFAMIVGIFTLFQFIVDVFRKKDTEYLLLINTIVFSVAIIGLVLFGFKTQGLNLSSYSIGHVYAYLGLIGVTGVLYILAQRFKEAPIQFPITLGAAGLIGSFGLMFVSPSMYNLLIKSFFNFFGQAAVTNTVEEAMGWSFASAWVAFNFGIVLMVGGVLIMLFKNTKDEHPYQMFVLVWSLTMLLSTWQHVRYEYYFAVNVVILSAVCVSYILERGLPNLTLLKSKVMKDIDKEEKIEPQKSKKKKTVQYKKDYTTPSPNYAFTALLLFTLFLGSAFFISSFAVDYSRASSNIIRMNPDWKESLEWMATGTPGVGINYTEIYDAKTFKYPNASYGVMSWWDYGHMITYIAKRIPNANPFQQGVTEEAGASNFFIATDESVANEVLNAAQTRYIITDIEMDTGKFYAMSTWHNSTVGVAPYQVYMLAPQGIDSYTPVLLNTNEYYLTMISRLHNFDGSYILPDQTYYIEYVDASVSQMSGPLITNAIITDYNNASIAVTNYNNQASMGHHAMIASPSIANPTLVVPALQHYRLVHESPTNVINGGGIDIKYVKIFEYIRGAHIKGEGVIEVTVKTNTGRTFMYRQQSVNGEFIVPYSTGNMYGIEVAQYNIIGSTRLYTVSENDVRYGLTVS